MNNNERLRNVAYAAKLLRLQEERARQTGPGGLMHFLRYHWDILEPSRPFVDGWVPQAIAEHLEAVTFNQITRLLINVPPGSMKPVWVEEPILTDRGFIRLADIKVGDQVLTHKGRFRKVTAIHDQGAIPIVKIATDFGRVVRAAPDHPFLTPKGWADAGNLTNHDYLGVPRLQESMPERRTVGPKEARLLGYLVGDGCISHPSLSFINADEEVLSDFEGCAAACGFYTNRVIHPNKNVKAIKVVLKSTKERWRHMKEEPPIRTWLRTHGLYLSNSYTKRIPPAIFYSGPEAIANFIGAYWSCDGCVTIRHQNKKTTMMAFCCTVGKGLAEDVQRALMVLNIPARIRTHVINKTSKKQPGGLYTSYHVMTCSRNEVAKLMKLPGLAMCKKRPGEKAFLDRFEPELYTDPVLSVDPDGVAPCRCLTVEEDCSFTVNGLAVHNSLMTNCFWPAWEWGPVNRPYLRGMSFSYAAHLTERDNDRLRTLVTSKKYQELWGGHFKLTSDAKIKISNDHMGWQLASSVRGISTGERADRLRLDDAHNVVEGESERVRTETVRWFKESMSNRLNDMDRSAIIVIMQRVHEMDVAGTIIEDSQGMGYEHLCIPMRHEIDGPWSKSTSIGWEDPRTADGELAWPERFSAKVVDDLERDLGPFAFSAQLQQNPAPRGGGIIRRQWFRLWEHPQNKFPVFINVVAAVDPAYTEKDENDPSAMAIFATFRHPETNEFGIMLVHCWRKRLPIHGDTSPRFPGESAKAYERRCGDSWGLVEWIWHCCDAYGVQQLFVEGKASGISVFQEIERRQSLRPWSCDIDTGKGAGDKTNRLTSVQPIFSQGLIWAPDRDWADMFIQELSSFPKGKYDDLCDCASSALGKMRVMGLIQHTDEREYDEYVEQNRPQALEPLYPV